MCIFIKIVGYIVYMAKLAMTLPIQASDGFTVNLPQFQLALLTNAFCDTSFAVGVLTMNLQKCCYISKIYINNLIL